MKISLQEVDRILRAQELTRAQDHRPAQGSETEEAGSYTPAAVVELSPEALEVQQVRKAVEEAPDAREEIVAELKARIESGTYDVSSEDIADLMVRRAYADSIR